MVPIRDPNLIGRKIDCPKCKYRFVVEEPDPVEEEEVEELEPAKKGARGPGDKRRADGKGAKAPARGGRRGREDDEDEEAPKAKGGSNTKILLGAGLGGLALIILGAVAIWFFVSGDSNASKSSTTPGRTASSNPSQAATDDKPATQEKPVTPVATTIPIELLTNLLPPETEGLCSVHVQSLMRTGLGHAIIDTPGAFRPVSLSQRLGFDFGTIDVLVQAWNFRQNWSLSIVHTDKPVSLEKIQKALRAKPADKKIEDQEYFVLEPNAWLDQLGRTTFALLLQTPPGQVPARSGPVAFYKFDDQTLLFADVKPMQDFLKVKGAFAHQSEAGKPKESGEQAQEAQAPAPEQGGRGGRGGQGGGTGMQQRMRAMMGGRGGPPGGEQPPADQTQPAEEPVASGSYLTINPKLKEMLDRVEGKQPVLSLAVDTRLAEAGNVKVLGANPLNLTTLFEEAGIIGAALEMKDKLVLKLGASYFDDEGKDEAKPDEGKAQKRLSSIKSQDAPDLAKALTKALNTKVKVDEEQPAEQSAGGTGPNLPPGPGGMGGMGFMGGPGRAGMQQMQQQMQQQQKMRGMMGEGGGMMGMGPRGGGMMGRGGAGMMGQFPGDPARQEEKPPEKPASTIKISMPDKTVIVLTINLVDQTANSDFLNGPFRHLVLRQKGYMDMASRQLRIHDLAAALRAYTESPPHQGQFPRGTALREIPSSRYGRPYPPDERVSWLVEMLPFLGAEQQALYQQRIDRNKSWRDPENSLAATTLVPQFLDPSYPENTWWVHYPGLAEDAAATHVVAIAGVGMNAPEYDANDPAVAGKIGVFGYDRVTKLADLGNRGARTILIAQVPPTFKRPWLAGGGSTVQGVPEKNSIQPFLIERDGKRGALVIMGDFTVRFISDKIPDDAFKALCTIKGGVDVNLNLISTVIPPPENQEPKFVEPPVTQAPAKKAPPKREPPKEAPKPEAKKTDGNEQVRAVLQKNCATCHTGAMARKRVQIFLSSGDLNPNMPRDKMQEMLAAGKMPPPRRPPLSDQDRAVLQEWLAAAAN
jgi:hypothetical protein